jgi:HEAT repeat protein
VSGGVDPRERQSVLHDLASTDEEVRRLAVERLVLLGPAEALPLVAERLGDPSWRVRKAAVECLSAAPEDWPVAQHLIAALADGEDPGRRNAAVEALVRIGRRMVTPLLEASASPDVDVRKLVVDALAGIGSERATPRLAELLCDPDPNVRGAAADALAALGGDDALRALRGAALRESEESLVRFAALRGLARQGAPLTAADLASALDDPLLRPVAFGALGRVADAETEEVLLKGLGAGSRAAREAAIEALLRLASRCDGAEAERLVARLRGVAPSLPDAIADATRRLEEADLATRLSLAQFLGVVAAPAAALPLLRAARADEALADVALAALAGFGSVAEEQIDQAWHALDADLRVLACEVLARCAGPRGEARLVRALDEPDPPLRAAAAHALARRGAADAAPALLRRLQLVSDGAEDEAAEERAALTDALIGVARATHDAAARRAVTELLASSFEGAGEGVRLAIARVLGALRDGAHASLLALLAQDPSAPVRRAAVASLAGVPGVASGEALRLALADEAASVRIAAATALGESGDPKALEALERLLGDDDALVRAAAVRAIAELTAAVAEGADDAAWRRADALLAPALRDRGVVALAAVEAFEKSAPALPLAPVRAALAHGDPEVVQSALRCLQRHGGHDELAALVPLVGHEHWAVRAGAIEALAERRFAAAVPAVLRRLDGESDDFVRSTLLRALQRLEEA